MNAIETRGFDSFLAQHGLTQWSSYQPNDRFWHFQMMEGAVYTLLAVGLAVAARGGWPDTPTSRQPGRNFYLF